jgi:translation initiation factor IF-2
MAASKKIRVYELAKELKQDPKKIIEDLRKEGADVSVPSNSVSLEIADKLRGKYSPNAEPKLKRAVKVIKKKTAETTPEAFVEQVGAAEEPVDEPIGADEEPEVEKVIGRKVVTKRVTADEGEESLAEDESEEADDKPPVRAKALKLRKSEVTATEADAVEETVSDSEEQDSEAPVIPQEPTQPERPKGTQVKQLTLTKNALEKGIKVGDKFVGEKPTKTGRLGGEPEKRRGDFRGTPGETASPITVYTPSAGPKRKLGRNVGRKGDRRGEGRFAERELNAPRPKSIEERIQEQVGRSSSESPTILRLVEGATVREFGEAIGVAPRDVVSLLMKKGALTTLNQPIDEKIAVEIGESLGFMITFVPFEEMVVEQEFEDLVATDTDDVELPRPPVVTVMGHVDHGKTSLLDAIRQENVAEGEAGGITQHIGAYSVHVPGTDASGENRRVVFLDTPGHEAFTMMRARGAKATDVVILVVAADDGVMPQTIEAIEHARAAKVPIVVAINKIDKNGANPEKVKQELAQQGLQPLDWGGDVEMVPVSAKNRENLETLLETVLLTSDILDLKASPTRRASGVVLEAKLDRGRGSVATVLVQQGTLKVGDPFIVGQFSGKVRAMFSDRGEPVNEAPPSTPVEVLGLQGVPGAGDTFLVVPDVESAQTIAGKRQATARQATLLKTTKRGIESLGQSEVKELLVVLKTDVQGSVEVLKATLEKLSTEKVKVRVIRSGVGAIAESDVLLASATQADQESTAVVIIGFNVRPEQRAAEVAKQESVDIRLHSIIYKVEEEIKAAMIGMLDAIEKENILGQALVLDTFKVSKVGMIAGCRVTNGLIKRQAKARLVRDSVVIWEGDISSLKRFKDDANEVREGFECGISLVNFNDIKVDDVIEAFVIEKIAATEL